MLLPYVQGLLRRATNIAKLYSHVAPITALSLHRRIARTNVLRLVLVELKYIINDALNPHL